MGVSHAIDDAAVGSERCFGLLGAGVVFHACVQAITIGLSLLSVRQSQVVAVGTLAISLAAALAFWRTGVWRTSGGSQERTARGIPLRLVVLVGWTIYLSLLVPAYCQHDISYDGNMYHLPTIHFWGEEGRVCWTDNAKPLVRLMNGYPKAVELLAFVLVQVCGDGGANLANLLFLPLGALGAACLARLLGVSRDWASAAGALWLLTPVCILQSRTLYVDGAYASCVVAFVAALAIALGGLKPPDAAWNWRQSFVLGASAGLCLAAKPTGIAVVGIGLVVACAYVVRLLILRRTTIFRTMQVVVASAVACVAVGGYWPIRNVIHEGSPFYPCGLIIAGRQILPGEAISAIAVPEADAAPDLRGLPTYQKIFHVWRQYRGWRPSFFTPDSRVGGLGFLWPLGCIPAIALLLWRFLAGRHAMNREAFFVMMGVVVAAFFVQPNHWWPRFTAWILTLGLPCFAVVADEICRRLGETPRLDAADAGLSPGRRFAAVLRRNAPLAWVRVCMVLAIVEGGLCGLSVVTGCQAMPHNWKEVAKIAAIYTQPKWTLIWPEMGGTAMERVLIGDDPVALGFYANHPPPREKEVYIIGGLISPLGRRRVVPVGTSVESDRLETLRQAGVRHVVWDDKYPVPAAFQACRVERSPGFYVVSLAE